MNKDMKLNAQAALGNIALTITTFAVTAFIIGPENPGYSTNLGPILGLLGFLVCKMSLQLRALATFAKQTCKK